MQVSITVDDKGVPSDLKVLQSVNPVIDKRILDAVQRYRFTPSMLDGTPIARQVTLKLLIPSSYGS